MEDTTFPVPESEAQKLDAVVQTLRDQPMLRKLEDSLRSQPWPFILGAFALGLLCSAIGKRR